ncbi:MAG: CheY-like chemotaxis protein [Alcanivorax sp.]
MPHDQIVHVVDPDESIGDALSALLETYQIAVRTYPDAKSFLETDFVEDMGSSCLLIEYSLPGLSGLSLLGELRGRKCEFPIIILTDNGSNDLRDQTRRLGATDVLEKPLMNSFLLDRLAQIFPDTLHPTPTVSGSIELPGSSRVTVHVAQPEDSALKQTCVKGLSAKSSHLGLFSALEELSPGKLERFTNPDYPGSYTLIATVMQSNEERQVGVARYMPMDVSDIAEFAVVIADKWQGVGLATHLLSALTTAAALAGINQLEGMVLSENTAMLKLLRKLGFSLSRCPDDATLVRVVKNLHMLNNAGENQQLKRLWSS